MKKKNLIVLLIIILLAVVLRVFQLDKAPPSLFGDEIDVGYQAYSLLKTGKDVYSQTLPFYIKSFSEYRAPLFIYSTVPTVALFGLNEYGVRLSAAFWGILSVLGIFLLGRKLISERLGLIAAFLMAISPWNLHYSRAAFEVTMLLSFVIFGTYFFLKGLEKSWFFIFTALLFGLSIYIYSTAVLFIPLWTLVLVVIYKDEIISKEFILKSKSSFIIAFFVLLLAILPMVYSVVTGVARERFGVVGIFQDKVVMDKINLARIGQEFFTPAGEFRKVELEREFIFHNKPFVLTQIFTQNYLRAFSGDFLFANGDYNLRHSIQETGELYKFEIITLILGIWFLIKGFNRRIVSFVLGLLFLTPIPSALTDGGGWHATRSFLMLIPLTLISGLGIIYILKNVSKNWGKVLAVIVVVLLIFNFTFYLHRYYIHYPIESWRFWHVGFKEAFEFIKDNEHKYSTVIINNSYEPSLVRYLFYTKYDPALFQKQFTLDQPIKDIVPGIDGFRVGEKLVFGHMNEMTKKEGGLGKVMKKGTLFMVSSRDDLNNLPSLDDSSEYEVVKTIVNPLNQPIFFLIEGR